MDIKKPVSCTFPFHRTDTDTTWFPDRIKEKAGDTHDENDNNDMLQAFLVSTLHNPFFIHEIWMKHETMFFISWVTLFLLVIPPNNMKGLKNVCTCPTTVILLFFMKRVQKTLDLYYLFSQVIFIPENLFLLHIVPCVCGKLYYKKQNSFKECISVFLQQIFLNTQISSQFFFLLLLHLTWKGLPYRRKYMHTYLSLYFIANHYVHQMHYLLVSFYKGTYYCLPKKLVV